MVPLHIYDSCPVFTGLLEKNQIDYSCINDIFYSVITVVIVFFQAFPRQPYLINIMKYPV